jgi:hypothetical protein
MIQARADALRRAHPEWRLYQIREQLAVEIPMPRASINLVYGREHFERAPGSR